VMGLRSKIAAGHPHRSRREALLRAEVLSGEESSIVAIAGALRSCIRDPDRTRVRDQDAPCSEQGTWVTSCPSGSPTLALEMENDVRTGKTRGPERLRDWDAEIKAER
jgi:hypothetical protein